MIIKLFRFSLLLLVIVSAFYQKSYSQSIKIDSLKSDLLKVHENRDKLQLLKVLCQELIINSPPDSNIIYFNYLVETAKSLDSTKYITRGYRYLSESYLRKQDFSKAEFFAKAGIRINDSIKNYNDYLLDINQLGRVYHHFEKYDKAISTYKNGIAKTKNSDISEITPTIFANLGHACGRLQLQDDQIEYYLQASKYADTLNNYQAKSFAMYSLAYLFMELEQFEKAEKYFLLALKDSLNIELKDYVFMNHHGLGINYSRWGKYNLALKHNNKALNYYQQTGKSLYVYDVLNNNAVAYLKMGWISPKKVDARLSYKKY